METKHSSIEMLLRHIETKHFHMETKHRHIEMPLRHMEKCFRHMETKIFKQEKLAGIAKKGRDAMLYCLVLVLVLCSFY